MGLSTKASKDGALRFEVHAKPRAKKSRVTAVGEVVDIALAAPPVDGAANEELIRFLAEVLGVPKRAVVLVRGEGSRQKLISVEGLAAGDLEARLTAAAASTRA